MSRADIRAGGGYVELSTRDAKFYAGLKRSLGAASKWAGSIGKLSAVGAAGFLAGGIGIQGGLQAITSAISGFSIAGFTKSFADAGSRLDDMSQRTGMAAEQLSALDYVAKMNDASLEDVGVAVKGMSNFLVAAADGSAEATDSLNKLGVSLGALRQADQFSRFRMLANALGQIPDPAAKAAMAMKVFGKGGLALLPMINAGSASFDELASKAQELGLIMSGEDASAAAELGDLMDSLSLAAGGLAKKIGAALTPQVTKILGTAIKIITPIGKWIEANRDLIGTIVPIAAAGFAAAAGLAVVAGGVALLAPLIPIGFKIGLGLLAAAAAARVVYRNFGTLAKIGGQVFRFVASSAASALGSLGGNFRAFFTWVVSGFRSFASGAIENLSAIATAVSAGELGAAFNLVLATFDMAWDATLATFQAGWGELTNNMALLGVEASYAFQIAWQNVFSNISLMAINAGSSFNDLWLSVKQNAALTSGFLITQFRRASYGLQIELAGLAEATKIAKPGTRAEVEQDLVGRDIEATAAERKSRGDYQAGLIDARAANERDRKSSLSSTEANRNKAVNDLKANRDIDREINKREGERRGDAAAERVSKAMEAYNKALQAAKATKGKTADGKPGVGPLALKMPGMPGFEGFGESSTNRAENIGTFSGFGAAVGSTVKYDQEQVKQLGKIHDTLREIALRNLGIA
jgi:hypothetical protein